MEGKTQLIAFQIAGLGIQTSLKLLISALKAFQKRKLCRFVGLWKFKTIDLASKRQVQAKNSVLFFSLKFRNFLNALKKIRKARVQDSFIQIFVHFKILACETEFLKNSENLKSEHDKERQSLSQEIRDMEEVQEELESNLKKMKVREESFKNKIQEISVKNNRRKGSKTGPGEIAEKIEVLREENSEIGEKIEMIENNVANFIKEMGGLLEKSEVNEKNSEKRRPSVKKVKNGKKSKAHIFNIDVSRN